MRIPSGKTDVALYFVAVDSTDLVTRETGLSSFTVYRSRNGGAATAYTTPTVTEISLANMPGVYSLLIDEDTTIASTSDSEEYCLHITQASMAPVTRVIELYRRDTTTGRTLAVDANSRVDLGTWVGSAPNALISGRVDSTVGAMQADVVTAAAIAADAIDAAAVASDVGTEFADALLKRDMSAVTGESARSPLNALRKLMNKWSIAGSTLTVTKEDDSTSAYTQTITTSGVAEPIVGLDTV
jgi:hypothetical protein